jgi:hypothetical protein
MEPITTAAIATVVAHIAAKGFEEVFKTSIGEFTKDSIHWLKSIFFKDEKPKEVLERLQEKPDSLARQDSAKAAIASALEDNPDDVKWLNEIVKVLEARTGNTIISHSKNVNTGTIQAGGKVVIGDNRRIK